MSVANQTAIHELDNSMPAAKRAKLGVQLDKIISNYNLLRADFAALLAAYTALVAKLDTDTVGTHAYSTTNATKAPTASNGALTTLGEL